MQDEQLVELLDELFDEVGGVSGVVRTLKQVRGDIETNRWKPSGYFGHAATMTMPIDIREHGESDLAAAGYFWNGGN